MTKLQARHQGIKRQIIWKVTPLALLVPTANRRLASHVDLGAQKRSVAILPPDWRAIVLLYLLARKLFLKKPLTAYAFILQFVATLNFLIAIYNTRRGVAK